MTGSNEAQKVEEMQTEQATARILELLEKLATAEGLAGAIQTAGVSEDQLRAGLRQAAQIIRKKQHDAVPKQRFPLLGSILDWQEMTVAEALEILGEHGMQCSAATTESAPPH